MNGKDEIIQRLKENGCRITKQRKILIDLLSAVAVVVSFPVLCFSQDFYQGLRAGLCLFEF